MQHDQPTPMGRWALEHQGDHVVEHCQLLIAMRRRDACSDATLASAAAVGDAAAFAELYERHVTAIYGYCRRVLRSRDEAADATHEAFVSVLERVRDASRPIT